MLEDKILFLKEKIISQAHFVKRMVKKTNDGLKEKDREILQDVISRDENIVNQEELNLDQLCVNIIALYQPEAGDLRTILMAYKMNNDLERMGDLAVNIAESSLYILDHSFQKELDSVYALGDLVLEMLTGSISAFSGGDTQLARKVSLQDERVDEIQKSLFGDYVKYMSDQPDEMKSCLAVNRILHNLERIADLSTNICEEVVYMVDGDVMKHNQLQPETLS